jgi:hypothetical protein
MAVFKTLNAKKKVYLFDFLGNRQDPHPAKAVFSRFPLSDETFISSTGVNLFEGMDLEKIARKDSEELRKLSKAFVNYLASGASKVNYEAFVRECIDHFEDFRFTDEDGQTREVKSVEDFLTINRQAMAAITLDCYQYARKEDEFSMGE